MSNGIPCSKCGYMEATHYWADDESDTMTVCPEYSPISQWDMAQYDAARARLGGWLYALPVPGSPPQVISTPNF